jgi:hypothetical protein
MLRFNGWFWYTFQDEKDFQVTSRHVNEYAAITHAIRFSPVVARKMGNHLNGILGINLNLARTEINPKRYVPAVKLLPFIGPPDYLAYNNVMVTQHDMASFAGVEYFYGFRNKVFVVLGSNFGVGLQRYAYEYTYYQPDLQSLTYKEGGSGVDISWKYSFIAALRPSIRVRLTGKLGIELGAGGLGYHLNGFLFEENIIKPDYHSFNVDFNPWYWDLGFFLSI